MDEWYGEMVQHAVDLQGPPSALVALQSVAANLPPPQIREPSSSAPGAYERTSNNNNNTSFSGSVAGRSMALGSGLPPAPGSVAGTLPSRPPSNSGVSAANTSFSGSLQQHVYKANQAHQQHLSQNQCPSGPGSEAGDSVHGGNHMASAAATTSAMRTLSVVSVATRTMSVCSNASSANHTAAPGAAVGSHGGVPAGAAPPRPPSTSSAAPSSVYSGLRIGAISAGGALGGVPGEADCRKGVAGDGPGGLGLAPLLIAISSSLRSTCKWSSFSSQHAFPGVTLQPPQALLWLLWTVTCPMR